jgi:hypothetical protein
VFAVGAVFAIFWALALHRTPLELRGGARKDEAVVGAAIIAGLYPVYSYAAGLLYSVPTVAVASAGGALTVAWAMKLATGRSRPRLRVAMAIWGAAWAVFGPICEAAGLPDGYLSGPSIAAWQVPIAIACARWLLPSPESALEELEIEHVQ